MKHAEQNRLTSKRVHIEGRDPLESRVHRLDELLREQIVHPDVSLGLRTPRQSKSTREMNEDVQRQRSEVGKGGKRLAEHLPSAS
jgi:uncharacterized protein YbbK (DUF523 family)